MRDRSFAAIVEDCLQRLDRGESLPDLLADFPDLADQLKPLLLVAMASRAFAIPVPGQTAQRLGRNQMLAEMNRLENKKAFRKKSVIPPVSRWAGYLVSAARSRGFTRLAHSHRLAMVSLVLILSGGFFTLSASASSQPGDLFYKIRLGLERAGLVLQERYMIPHLEEPVEFRPVSWEMSGLFSDHQDPDSAMPDSFQDEYGFEDPDLQDELRDKEAEKDLKEEEKDLAAAEKEADKDLKEEEKDDSATEKDEEKDLKEDEKDEAAAEKDEEKDLKEDEKDEAAAEKDEEKDLKEEEKDEAAAEKDEEKDLKEEEKDAASGARESDKDEKKADKIDNQRVKDPKDKK